MIREQWQPGQTAWFEYHCCESHDSGDAQAWYRSHQKVTILSEDLDATGSSKNWPESTFENRCEDGTPRMYRVRFADPWRPQAPPSGGGGCQGLEWDVFEDELLTNKKDFCRPDPPLAQCKGI